MTTYGPYPVSAWREDDATWSATATNVSGANTAADSLKELDHNIKEAIALALDLPRGAEATMTITLDVHIDGNDIDALVAQARHERQIIAHARATTEAAVHALRDKGISVRDAARLIGITAGRVSQLDKIEPGSLVSAQRGQSLLQL